MRRLVRQPDRDRRRALALLVPPAGGAPLAVGSSSGSGVSCGGRSASGTWRRLTRMRVHVDDRPRMQSTSTSSTASWPPPRDGAPSSARGPRARALSGELATTTSGIFARGGRFAPPPLRRATARRAAPRPPSCGSAAATARRRGRPPRRAPPARAARRASRAAASMPACGSPIAAKRAGTVRTREVGRLAVGHLVPGERRRHARVGQRPHRVGRAGRAVLGVLVVVEEHAVALLLPPLRGRERGRAALDLARQRERGAAHLGERPARLDAHVDVHAARAAGLRPAARPSSSSSAFTSSATRRTSAHATPGPGSRSTRSSSG